MRSIRPFGWTILIVILFPAGAQAGVEIEQRSRMELSGALGAVSGMLGGKAARDGITTTEIVVGNRKLSRTEDQGQIIDLDEEKVYEIDWNKKRYSVVTFDEMRRRFEEMRERTASSRDGKGEGEYDIEFEIRESGQNRTIQGLDCREVVLTVRARPQDQPDEGEAGMLLTSSIWLSDEVEDSAEVDAFNRRFAELVFGAGSLDARNPLAAMSAMYPGLEEAAARFEEERIDLEGTPMLTTMSVTSMGSAGQDQQQPSMGRMLGGLGGLFGKKKKEESQEPPSEPKPLLTVTSEVLSIRSGVGADAVALPEGFRLRD